MSSARENLSFADILREKMTDFSSENSINNAHLNLNNPYVTDTPTTENQLLRWVFQAPMKSSGYKTPPQRPSHVETPRPATAPEKHWAVSTLSVATQLALVKLGLQDKIEISRSMVKRAYRQLARKLHPDLNPTDGNVGFLALKEAQDCILSEIKK